MEECVCGEQAVYICKPCQVPVCEYHKAIHEKGKEIEHIFEKLGQKLSPKKIAKIVDKLSSNIKIANECAIQIFEASRRLLAIITNSCKQALDLIKEKQQYYACLLKLCHEKLYDDQIEEIVRISRKSLRIIMPSHQFKKIQDIYRSDFLKEFEKPKNNPSMPENRALPLLEGIDTFILPHTTLVYSIAITSDSRYLVSSMYNEKVIIWNLQDKTQEATFNNCTTANSIAITSDNKYIVSGGSDMSVRIWNFQDKTQEAILQGHTKFVYSIAITSDNNYILSGGADSTVRIWNFPN